MGMSIEVIVIFFVCVDPRLLEVNVGLKLQTGPRFASLSVSQVNN